MWTATALRADIVLPASTSVERNDIAGNRRCDMLIAMKQAVAPVGEARSDFAIFAALAGRLGVGQAFTEGRDEMDWLRHLYQQTRADAAARFDFEMPGFERFWRDGAAAVPTARDLNYLAEFRADPDGRRLATESGRIVLDGERLSAWDYADCRPHPAWLPPREWLDRSAETERVFHLLTPQPEGRLHSQLVHAGPSGARMPDGRERLRIHSADADSLGLGAGDTARLWNARGSCLVVVQPYEGIRRGVLALPTGAWFTPGEEPDAPELSGNPNVLTWDVPSSTLGQGCAAQTCLVRIEPWRGNDTEAAAAYDAALARAVSG